MTWIDTIPRDAGPARERAVLDAVKAGQGRFDWFELTNGDGTHRVTFRVFRDALKIDGIRVTVTPATQQLIADELSARLMTPKICDLIWVGAAVKIPPSPRSPNSTTTQAMIEHSRRVDGLVAGRSGMVADPGKDWVLVNELSQPRGGISPWASNYGWHVAPSETRVSGGRRQWKGVDVGNVATADFHGDAYVIQGYAPTHPHNNHHTDYSQIVRLVHRDCTLDGRRTTVDDVLRGPRASLLSHQGPMTVFRQPGVPRASGEGFDEGFDEADATEWLEDLDPARLFDTVAEAQGQHLPAWVSDRFEVVARPNESLVHAGRGDVLVRRALGEGRLAFTSMVLGPESVDVPPHERIVLRPRRGGSHGRFDGFAEVSSQYPDPHPLDRPRGGPRRRIWVTRAEWGADAALPRRGTAVPKTERTRVFIHHTVGPDNDDTPNAWEDLAEVHAQMRTLQRSRPDLGTDVPYNVVAFCMSNGDLVLCEGRGLDRSGAHTVGYNRKAIGISFAGNFQNTPLPTYFDYQLRMLGDWLRELRTQQGFTNLGSEVPSPSRDVWGHREVKATACPGEHLWSRLHLIQFV